MSNLTARKVKTAGPGKYEDGDGLRLVVSSSGAKKWVLRITVQGRRREMGLGSYPGVTLADARFSAAEQRKLAKSGTDPIAARAAPIDQVHVPTFSECADHYIAAHAPGWRNAKHAAQWRSTLATYAIPVVGPLPVNAVTDRHILSILEPIWTRKTETAKRVQCRLENILDWAAAMKYRDGENPARWRGYLDKLLPRPSRVKKVRHHPAMPYTEVPGFFAELAVKGGLSALALRFLILTACRTSEVLHARRWEFDLAAAIWTIPATRMKALREHRVPLPESAVTLLGALPQIAGNDYLFPGSRSGRPLSNMALLQLMRGMGYGVRGNRGAFVPHGFRSSFRDWCAEQSSFPREVAEAALAHVLRDKTEAAYQRGDLFEKRRRLMAAWAEHCSTAPAENPIATGTIVASSVADNADSP